MAPKRQERTTPRHEDLLLNPIDPGYIDGRFRRLNFPHEIRRIRKEFFRAFFAQGVYVPSRDLSLGVVEALARAHKGGLDPAYMRRAEATLRARRNLDVPGLRGKFNHMSVARILEYYGLGIPKRAAREYGHYVKPWRVDALVRLYQRDRFIDLRDVYWMQGRFPPAGGRYLPRSGPSTGAPWW